MGKLLLLAAGLLVLGLGLFGKRLVVLYSSTAVMLLNTIVLLLLVESGLYVGSAVRSWTTGSGGNSPHEQSGFVVGKPLTLSYYKEQPWAKQYFREYERAWEFRPPPYEPYVMWRNLPFEGETINITEEGWRRTPGSECAPDSYRIAMFGGSTMWGTGVPDWGTIPAHLQAAISQRGGLPVCVMNLSEQAYVSTQSIVELVLELRAGRIPELVVFYDGINDVFAAYQSGLPGVHQNLGRIAARFEERDDVPPLVSLLSRTRAYRTVYRIVNGRKYGGHAETVVRPDTDLKKLAAGIGEVYAGNEALVAALGQQYGFEHVFFWQPVLLLEQKPLTDEEVAMRELALSVYPGIEELFRRSYEKIEELSRNQPRVRYLADIFRSESSLVYVDPWHVTLEGNQKIAREMLSEIDPILRNTAHGIHQRDQHP